MRTAAGRRACLVALAVAAAAGCTSPRPAPQEPAPADEQAGTIRRVGTFGFGIVPDSDPGTRYAPDALPQEFEQDGLRVLFRGTASSPDPNVRTWGTPFRLAGIRRAP